MPPETLTAQRIEQAIRTYINACNDADATRIAACFHPDAVHYFPSFPKWTGASVIGGNFARVVNERGYHWTVDQVLVDSMGSSAVLEWTMFDGKGRIVRGVDWFVFDPETLRIQEVRAYGAGRVDPEADRQELREFPYAARGYPTARPAPEPDGA